MATKRIAGITIEIGGDTSDLTKSLKGVDSQLKTTQANLKDIDKLLKFDPKNTELLAQKQKNLQTAISDTKKRLDTLKKAQTDALSPDEYDALQREIIETENNLKDLQKQYKTFGSVSKQKIAAIGESLKQTGEKVTEFGKGWSTYVTAPIVAVGAAAYKGFTEVDEGMDTIILKTGATGDALDEMGGIMQDIATSIPTDFATAGEAVGEVNTRFHAQGEQLRTLSEQYVKFAQINGTDVTSAVDSTQKALEAFGKDATDAGVYLDHLTKVSQDTGVSINTLTSGAVQNQAAFKEMGLSLYGATTFMGQLEVSGADSSAVMSGLSKALQNATKDGTPLEQALAELQKTIVSGTDSTDGLTAAYDLFGKSGAQVYEAVRNGTLDFTELNNVADGTANTVTETFNATLDPADNFETAMNAIKATGASIAEVVMPALNKALEKVRKTILKVKSWWDGLEESQQQTILTVAGIVAAIGPLLIGAGKIISLAGSLISIMSGPAGIVVAIGAVVAAGVYMVKHWDEVKEKAKEIWEKIKKFFADGWQKIKDIDWAAVGQAIWDGVVNVMTDVGTWLKDRFDEAVTLIKKIDWEQVGKDLWAWISGAFTEVATWLGDRFEAARKAIADIDWAALGKALWAAIKTAFNTVVTWMSDKFDAAKTAIADIDWAALGKGIWSGIKAAFSKVGSWFESKFTSAAEFIEDIDWAATGKAMWKGIKGAFSGIGEWFKEKFKDVRDTIKDIKWSKIGEAIWSAIDTALTGFGDWLVAGFKEPINAVLRFMNKVISGVESAINAVIDGINDKLSISWTIPNPFGNDWKIEWSPGIKNVSWGRLKELATGGSVSEGQHAIVGENAPEYLRVIGGQAIVTPIAGADRGGSGDTINTTINVYAQPGQDVRQIATEVQRIMVRQQQQREVAYA